MKKLLIIVALLLATISLTACEKNTNLNQTFTLEELAQHDGQDGEKAYIAVDGIVYDVTNVEGWIYGQHQGILLAGTDATQSFASSPHSQETLNELKKVGTLVTSSKSMETANDTLKVYTLNELANYSGANGTTAYMAVDGVVYDVSGVFTNGMHQGIQLGGTDATAVFATSPHSASILTSLTVVGSLEGYSVTQNTNSTQTTYYPVITLDNLQANTGANGTAAYMAVNGVVYDVSGVFTNGMHQGIQLGGTDATQVFASSPHSSSILSSLPIIGTLDGSPLLSMIQTEVNQTTDNDENIAFNNLPEAIILYIQTNYPNLIFDEAEFEHGIYEIEFTNDTELKFDVNGQFLSVEIDD